MLVNDLQSSNALAPIEVTPSGITTLVSDEHPLNPPIEVTPSGITTLANDEHPLNAS